MSDIFGEIEPSLELSVFDALKNPNDFEYTMIVANDLRDKGYSEQEIIQLVRDEGSIGDRTISSAGQSPARQSS